MKGDDSPGSCPLPGQIGETGSILYELVCCSEWTEDREQTSPFVPVSDGCSSVLTYVNPSKYLQNRKKQSAETLTWIKSIGPSWLYSVTEDGNIIAILQNTVLETRSSKDNFASVIGKALIVKDPFPNFRSISWSPDSSLLAVAFTNGHIVFYDILASQMFSITLAGDPIPDDPGSLVFSLENSLSGFFFLEERLKKTTYCSELVTVDRRGTVRSFRQLNSDEVELHHEASLRTYYPREVTDVKYSRTHGIMLVAGTSSLDSRLDDTSARYGVTAWRLLNDVPYYKPLFQMDGMEYPLSTKLLWKRAIFLSRKSNTTEDNILKLVISPNQNRVLGIHNSGMLSVWTVPSLKTLKILPLKGQHQYNIANPRFNQRWRAVFNQSNKNPVDPFMYHPFDVEWWNDESVIISRINGCVTVMDVDSDDPTNLLGDSPELFESPVHLTRKFEKGFFVLEAEVRPKTIIRKDSLTGLDIPVEESESWIKSLAQEVLFWATDIERFRPPRKRRKRPPVWSLSHRLFAVRKITPQELFHRKIEQEEYGEALDLARIYKLDSDLVFQRQWIRKPVSVYTIKDYLAKITKRNWVLQECLDRVPESLDATRALLQFGLRGTDLTVAVLISQGKDKGQFILWKPDDLDISEEQYISLIDPENKEVLRLLQYRKQFLRFLDILNTYEKMVGGGLSADENFDHRIYAKLRNRSLVESAIEMAQHCDINGLRKLLINHWKELSNYYLEIISNFPETWSPYDYKDFLPELDDNGKVVLWTDIAAKDLDWCDQFLTMDLSQEVIPTPEDIQQWYEDRIQGIEKFSYLTNYALDLGLLGLERNVLGIQHLVQELQTLETIVYEVGIENISLENLKDISSFDRMILLLSKTKEDTFVRDFRFYVNPFLNRCSVKDESERFNLLNQYLTSISKKDLKSVLQIFEASRSDEFDPLIPELGELFTLASNCIYSCESPKQGETILKILGCLPDRGYGQLSPEMEELHSLIEQLEHHYHACTLLEKYNVLLTMNQMKQISDNYTKESTEEFFVNLCRHATKLHPPLKLPEWKSLLYDILELEKSLFRNFPMEACFEIYVNTILRSGSPDVIKLAKDFIEKHRSEPSRRHSSAYSTYFALYLHIIPYDRALEMILEAAQMYFDSSSNYSDPDIELCKVCLNLSPNPKEPRVTYLFDLIDAVKLINKDFKLNILPHSVRICQDKIELIHQAVERTPDGYKKIQQLLKLVMLLHIENLNMSQAESIVLEMAGNAAMTAGDTKMGIQICQNIMGKEYNTGWKIFTQLAKVQSDFFVMDNEMSISFINYALNICPDDEISNVLNTKYLVELHSIQNRLMELSPDNSGAEVALLENQKEETIVKDTINQIQLEAFLNTATRWITPLKQMADVVKSGSGSLLPHLRRERDTGEHSSIMKRNSTEIRDLTDFRKECYPVFYLDKDDEACPYISTSVLSYAYDSFSNVTTAMYTASNPAVEHCILLNRIWHLEKLILCSNANLKRDHRVLEQLVCEILPLDLPWGLSILLSLDDSSTAHLSDIFGKLKVTPVSVLTCLYYLSLRIQKEVLVLNNVADDGLCFRNPNKIIKQTSELLSDGVPETDKEEVVSKLSRLFQEYERRLKEWE